MTLVPPTTTAAYGQRPNLVRESTNRHASAATTRIQIE
jgi:hypothetical protein